MAETVTEHDAGNDEWSGATNDSNTTTANADIEGTLGGPFHEPRPAPNPAVFQQLDGSNARAATRNDIDLVLDIPVQLTVELGRTKLPIRSLLQLAQGSVVELDGLAGEPMDVLVNGCLIAQGEVVVVNEKFGIRLTDVITPSERMKRLNK